MSTPISSPEDTYHDRIRDFYDILSPHFREMWGPHLHDGFYETGKESKEVAQDQLVQYLSDFADLPHDARGFDIGCGMGATSVWLAKNLGSHMTGITLSPKQVEMAQELAKKEGVDAHFRVADAESLEINETFDFIWMVGVLGHFNHQEKFLRNSARLLKPGGKYLLADWTIDPKLSDEIRNKEVQPILDGMLMPTMESLEDYIQWMEESGFEVLDHQDITESTLKTWEQGISITEAPTIAKMAMELGKDALNLLDAIRRMRSAMKKRHVRYSIAVARKKP